MGKTVVLAKEPEARTLEDQVREIVAEILVVDESKCGLDELLDDLGADSLDTVELAMTLEERLLNEQTIAEHEFDGWKTVGDVLETVRKMRK